MNTELMMYVFGLVKLVDPGKLRRHKTHPIILTRKAKVTQKGVTLGPPMKRLWDTIPSPLCIPTSERRRPVIDRLDKEYVCLPEGE